MDILQQWRVPNSEEDTKKLTQQMILLSSSQLAFSHCPLEKEQQLSWAGECRETLWSWGCQSVIHRWNKEKEESRTGLESPYLTLWLTCKLPWSLLQRLLQKMKTTSLEGKFRRAFSSEDNRECCHQRYLLSHVDQGNNWSCRKATREVFGYIWNCPKDGQSIWLCCTLEKFMLLLI